MTADESVETCCYVPTGIGEARLNERGSKFLALCAPAADEAAALAVLEERCRLHHDATHHCWAFRVGDIINPLERSSDAGEPSGTAGRPILDQLRRAEMVGAVVVVSRWFGGVKLGKAGLARAYSLSAAAAIEAAAPERRLLLKTLEILCDYDLIGLVEKTTARFEGRVIEGQYSEKVRLRIEAPAARIEAIIDLLREGGCGRIQSLAD